MMRRDRWRTSRHSGPNGQCVQLRNDLSEVRDSKNPDGATLRADLHALVTAAKIGQFDR